MWPFSHLSPNDAALLLTSVHRVPVFHHRYLTAPAWQRGFGVNLRPLRQSEQHVAERT